jgi:hypothetical protein
MLSHLPFVATCRQAVDRATLKRSTVWRRWLRGGGRGQLERLHRLATVATGMATGTTSARKKTADPRGIGSLMINRTRPRTQILLPASDQPTQPTPHHQTTAGNRHQCQRTRLRHHLQLQGIGTVDQTARETIRERQVFGGE